MSLWWLLVSVCVRFTCSHERTHIFVDIKLNRSEARKFCQKHHVNLSSILNEADYQKLQSLEHQNKAWIGLYPGPQNWTWTDGSRPTFFNWKRYRSCAAVVDGLWVGCPCNANFPFICQTNQGKYETVSGKKTWWEAKSYCEDEERKLATFKNASTKPDEWPKTLHWMGLKKMPLGWTWVDEDGVSAENRAVLTYSNWKTVKLCGLMSYDREWEDLECYHQRASVCSDGQKYELAEEPLSWHEAQQKCREKNMHLVSIHNASQNNDVRVMFYGNFWIGLHDNPWKWPGGTSAQLQYWGSGQPTGNRLTNRCVLMEEGWWKDEACSLEIPFFCLMKPQEKLKLQTAPSGWVEALLHCRGLGGNLAGIGDHDNQMLIQQVAQAARTTHVWVGLRFLAGEWVWLSDVGMMYHHWAAGGGQEICPLHHCGAIRRSTGYWEPRGCEEKLDFLCQLP